MDFCCGEIRVVILCVEMSGNSVYFIFNCHLLVERLGGFLRLLWMRVAVPWNSAIFNQKQRTLCLNDQNIEMFSELV